MTTNTYSVQAVSYTHLDVYKRQGVDYTEPYVVYVAFLILNARRWHMF